MDIETPINHFKTIISNYQAEFTISGEGTDENISLRLVCEDDDSIRQGKSTVDNLPEKIIQFYQGMPILRTFFDEIHDNIGKDVLKISEEGDFIFIKRIELSKAKINQKKFLLSTKYKEMTEKEIILNMQKEIKQLKRQMMNMKKKQSRDEIFSNLFSRIEALEAQNLKGKIKSKEIEEKEKKQYRFSDSLRGDNVKILSNGRACEQINSKNYRYVVVENSRGIKNQNISFKIKNLATWMTFGVGLLDKIQSFNFKDDFGDKISYSISTANQTYLLNKPSSSHQLEFKIDDIVDIKLQKDMISFSKRGTNENAVNLTVEFTEEQWKNAVFYVILNTIGIGAEIVQ